MTTPEQQVADRDRAVRAALLGAGETLADPRLRTITQADHDRINAAAEGRTQP